MTRRFLTVGNRRVHYFRAGDGPPVVLIHSSPANARLLMKEIERLSRDFTVFAFDTPGFGLSNPLPLADMEVADLADAMAETLRAIGMPRCPVFGTHTGAAIALELGVRHPECVTGLVLDGVPAFTDAECAAFFGDYFRDIPPTDLGGQYSSAWTRFRDQSIWFPWTNREPDRLNAYDLSPPHSTDLWTSMYFEAAEGYKPAYRAASFWGDKALAAAATLTLPAVYCATDTDMLHPHLARLPAMKPGQAIVPIGASYERRRELTADSFTRFGAAGPPPGDCNSIGSSDVIARQFIDGSAGPLHLRFCGDRSTPALLLFHDAPGSSEQSEALISRLAERFFVIAPDLPGNGESDAFAEPPAVADYAAEAELVCEKLGLTQVIAYGIGFGSSAALAFATRSARVAGVALQGMPLPDQQEGAAMVAAYTPPIEIEPDGAHWYRTWLMLRDSQVYWPWYERTEKAQRRVPADFGARRLHRWTMDVMRARESYGQLIQAALKDDAGEMLAVVSKPLVLVRDPSTPLSAHDARARAVRPDVPVLGADTAEFVNQLSASLRSSRL